VPTFRHVLIASATTTPSWMRVHALRPAISTFGRSERHGKGQCRHSDTFSSLATRPHQVRCGYTRCAPLSAHVWSLSMSEGKQRLPSARSSILTHGKAMSLADLRSRALLGMEALCVSVEVYLGACGQCRQTNTVWAANKALTPSPSLVTWLANSCLSLYACL
jgi:hypothetical protein